MRRTILIGSALLLALATNAAAQPTNGSVRLAVRPESKLLLEGDSNLHGWHCNATSFDAVIEMDSADAKGMQANAQFPTLLKRVEVKVPVRNLKCGNGGMEKNLYKALKADEAAVVTYIMGTFTVLPADTASGFVVKAAGSLTVAGKENAVKMDVRAARMADGGIRARGEVELLMTDYGIKPPTAMLGTMRTKDKVVVKFDLMVGPETIAAALGGTDKE